MTLIRPKVYYFTSSYRNTYIQIVEAVILSFFRWNRKLSFSKYPRESCYIGTHRYAAPYEENRGFFASCNESESRKQWMQPFLYQFIFTFLRNNWNRRRVFAVSTVVCKFNVLSRCFVSVHEATVRISDARWFRIKGEKSIFLLHATVREPFNFKISW